MTSVINDTHLCSANQPRIDHYEPRLLVANNKAAQPGYIYGHYANTHVEMPVQFTWIFNGFKNDNFQIKKKIVFLFFAQNIDHGYTLEPS